MNIQLLRCPDADDWKRCLMLARATQWREDLDIEPSENWKHKMLVAKHSPIRTLPFTILLKDIPYYSAMHFVRHKVGCEWYVSSQRNDKERALREQGTPVNVILDCNAQALMVILMMRLCFKADDITRSYAEEIKASVEEACPEFRGLLKPRCGYSAENCPEVLPCHRL